MTRLENVDRLVTGSAIKAWPHTDLRELSSMFMANNIGAALVRDREGRVVGMITERDVVRAVAEGADPEVERVEDYMTFDVDYVDSGSSPVDAAERMLENNFRHLPVRDDEGIEGMLSIRDVLAAVIEYQG